MADSKTETIDFSGDGKGKTATVETTKNVPLALFFEEGKVPAKFAKHPGGARVERGTKVTVTEDGAKYLKKIGYAK